MSLGAKLGQAELQRVQGGIFLLCKRTETEALEGWENGFPLGFLVPQELRERTCGKKLQVSFQEAIAKK